MRRTGLAAAAALALAFPAASAAAPIDCSFDEFPAATRQTLGSTFVAGLSDRAIQPGQAELIALKTAAETCATRYKWTEGQKKAAFFHTFSRVLLEAIGVELSKEGIEPASVERAFAGVPLEDRRAFFGEKLGDEGVNVILEAAAKQGITLDSERKVVLYTAMMAGIDRREKAAEEFAAP